MDTNKTNGKLTIPVILTLISWNTLSASIFPILIGILYSQYHYHTVNKIDMAIYFVITIMIHLIVNVLDNLNDFEVAVQHKADMILNINPIYKSHLNKKQVLSVIYTLMMITIFLGIWLVIRTNLILLIIGVVALGIATLYSKIFQNSGIGELLSGLTMGFLIVFSGVYINTFSTVPMSLKEIIEVFIVSLPNTLWIANMMLANNICDIDYDRKCGRNTYPIRVGIQKAISAFNWFNVLAFIAIIVAVILKLIPISMLLTLILIPFVYKQCRIFKEKQDKATTFLAAVKILAIGSLIQFITFLVMV